jgi:hypothetical protein
MITTSFRIEHMLTLDFFLTDSLCMAKNLTNYPIDLNTIISTS